jgi:hypothetical protein
MGRKFSLGNLFPVGGGIYGDTMQIGLYQHGILSRLYLSKKKWLQDFMLVLLLCSEIIALCPLLLANKIWCR